MHQFHCAGAGDDGFGHRRGALRRVPGAQGERRPQPFAARREQMAGDVAEQPVVGGDGFTEPGFDAYEVVLKRRDPHFVE